MRLELVFIYISISATVKGLLREYVNLITKSIDSC
jgi:hypothetical protein